MKARVIKISISDMKIKRSHTSVRFKLSQAHSYYTKPLRLAAENSQENERNQTKITIS